jgi:hypothetical protein
MQFSDGTNIPCKEEVSYLGCLLNGKADTNKELRKRTAACMATWRLLDVFFIYGNATCKFKMLVWDVVIRSKLLYGLESAQLTEAAKKRLDTFHLKGLGKILGMTTTYIDRANSNAQVYAKAAEQANQARTGPLKPVLPISQVFENNKIRLLVKTILKDQNDPQKAITFFDHNLKLRDTGIKRADRPRTNWHRETMHNYWKLLGDFFDPSKKWTILNLDLLDHVSTIRAAAAAGIGL